MLDYESSWNLWFSHLKSLAQIFYQRKCGLQAPVQLSFSGMLMSHQNCTYTIFITRRQDLRQSRCGSYRTLLLPWLPQKRFTFLRGNGADTSIGLKIPPPLALQNRFENLDFQIEILILFFILPLNSGKIICSYSIVIIFILEYDIYFNDFPT